MQPWEVNSIDMLKFADEFPEYVMMGGIYKHIFEPGDPAQVGKFKSNHIHRAIDDERDRDCAIWFRCGYTDYSYFIC